MWSQYEWGSVKPLLCWSVLTFGWGSTHNNGWRCIRSSCVSWDGCGDDLNNVLREIICDIVTVTTECIVFYPLFSHHLFMLSLANNKELLENKHCVVIWSTHSEIPPDTYTVCDDSDLVLFCHRFVFWVRHAEYGRPTGVTRPRSSRDNHITTRDCSYR